MPRLGLINRTQRKPIRALTGILWIAAGLLMATVLARPASIHAGQEVRVRWVIDGDTVVLTDGRHVRYPSINCPEIAHRDRPAEPLGIRAHRLNQRLVSSGSLRLVPAEPSKDRYKRCLADLVLEDGTSVSHVLVASGLAYVLPEPENSAGEADLLEVQRKAMTAGEGIWALLGTAPAPVVGNRRSKRFHRPDCPSGKKIGKRHRVSFPDYFQAFYDGYAPCRQCFSRLDDIF